VLGLHSCDARSCLHGGDCDPFGGGGAWCATPDWHPVWSWQCDLALWNVEHSPEFAQALDAASNACGAIGRVPEPASAWLDGCSLVAANWAILFHLIADSKEWKGNGQACFQSELMADMIDRILEKVNPDLDTAYNRVELVKSAYEGLVKAGVIPACKGDGSACP
jgi:hypothetical protein